MTPSLFTIFLLSGTALVAGITTDDGGAAKRTVEYSQAQARVQSRRIQAGPAHLSQNHHHGGRQPARRGRPSLPTPPPYAVQMEPLVQYSQRDPLYYQRHEANLTRDNSIEEKVLRIDHDSDGTSLAEAYGAGGSHHFDHNYYYREPEPIIEIIIKESNETLPAPPPPLIQPVKPTKEPVHVFYVKYKKNPKGKGDNDIIYEAPVPAITPPTDQIEEESSPHIPDTVYEAATVAPPPSTTLRTIIHPDSEFYHGSSLKVTFGETEVKSSDATYGESNTPEPSIALPQKEAQNRESTGGLNLQSSIKRQGTYLTIPQEVYDQNPPKSAVSPTFQSPAGKFQQNSFQHQSLQHLQFQQPQSQHQKVNFPRQAPLQQQPAFRPQHSGSLLNQQQQQHQQQQHQQQHHQQQFNQRPQFQSQTSQVQQRQVVPRQQSNPYSTLQSPTQNTQQRPQFRQQPQQFDQRPVHYSQPLNIPSQPQRSQPQQDPQHLHQQQIAQQQVVQSQFRNQPINVPNQGLNSFNQQSFPTSQPLIKPIIPLPSKPIHPQFAHHYQQQISLAQQHRQNFIPSTHQPQQALQSQSLQTNQHQFQQQYRFSQPINIPQQQSTSQPLQSYQFTTPTPQVTNAKPHVAHPVIPNFSDSQVIKAIPQSEEHQLQPQYNQQTLVQNTQQPQQPTIEQINQLNQLRNQQINQLNQQLLNQQQLNQQINQQLYLQQQQNQQQFGNNDFSNQHYVNKNHQRPSQFSQTNQLVSTTSQPVKSTTGSYQTKYSQSYSRTPSTTPTPTEETPTSTTEDPEKVKEKEVKFKANLAALPDEVPDDIREQLLSSGILSNADISILDYDKVGDIPIENLPPEALENFYGAGSAPVPAVVAPENTPIADSVPEESKDVEMKVVHYDPSTKEGQKVEESYIKDDATQVDSVILNDSKYNRYLPLKVSGSNFPLPDASVLVGKKVNSVVVLAPVDYDFVSQAEEEEERTGRSAPVQVQGVRFIAGNILKTLIKDPTTQNYKSWLAKEKSTPTDRQSVVLLVVSDEGKDEPGEKGKEIFMYDIASEKLSRLRGELSTTFVEVAENNAQSQELDGLADTEGAASSLHPVRIPPAPGMFHYKPPTSAHEVRIAGDDLAIAASETDENAVYQAPTISSGYSKMAVQ